MWLGREIFANYAILGYRAKALERSFAVSSRLQGTLQILQNPNFLQKSTSFPFMVFRALDIFWHGWDLGNQHLCLGRLVQMCGRHLENNLLSCFTTAITLSPPSQNRRGKWKEVTADKNLGEKSTNQTHLILVWNSWVIPELWMDSRSHPAP